MFFTNRNEYVFESEEALKQRRHLHSMLLEVPSYRLYITVYNYINPVILKEEKVKIVVNLSCFYFNFVIIGFPHQRIHLFWNLTP